MGSSINFYFLKRKKNGLESVVHAEECVAEIEFR